MEKTYPLNKLLKYESFDTSNIYVFVNAEARNTQITFKDNDAQRLQKKKSINFYSIDSSSIYG